MRWREKDTFKLCSSLDENFLRSEMNLLTDIIVSEQKSKAVWPKSSVFNNLDKLDKIPNANFKQSKISMCF